MSREDEQVNRIYNTIINKMFDDRQRGLMSNSVTYACNNPSGLPGHNLMLIIERYDYLIYQFAFLLSQIDNADEIVESLVEGYRGASE